MDVSWVHLNNWWRQDPLYKVLPTSMLKTSISLQDTITLVDNLRPLYLRYLDSRFASLTSISDTSGISNSSDMNQRRIRIICRIYQRAIGRMFARAYANLRIELQRSDLIELTVRDCLNMWGQALQESYLALFKERTYQWGYAKLLEALVECH